MILLLACTAGPDSGLINNGDPWIELVSPVEDSTVCGTPLVVDTQVANLELVPPVEDTAAALDGTGHIDIMLNGQDLAMVWEERTEVPVVPDGVYQLKVELSYADHSPIEPYAGDLAYITIDEAVCDG